MKRNEMHQKLIKFVADNKDMLQELDFETIHSFTDEILDLVEYNGMLPPGYQDEKTYPYFDTINEWEPEDEKK